MANDTWYFVYGSNLLIDQKVRRTGPIRQGYERPKIATLKDYRLAFNKQGGNGNVYANIVPSLGDEVIGVVYRWNDQSRRKMGVYEKGYEQKFVDVVTKDKPKLSAVTFVAKPECVCDEARPSNDYLCKIITGAAEHGLPSAYIQQIECIAKNKRSNATHRYPRQLVLSFFIEPNA
jgi:cation transport regulator ChaC